MKILLAAVLCFAIIFLLNWFIQTQRARKLPFLHESPSSNNCKINLIYNGHLADLYYSADKEFVIISGEKEYYNPDEHIKLSSKGKVLARIKNSLIEPKRLFRGLYFGEEGYIDWIRTDASSLSLYNQIYNADGKMTETEWNKLLITLYEKAEEVRFIRNWLKIEQPVKCLFRNGKDWTLLWALKLEQERIFSETSEIISENEPHLSEGFAEINGKLYQSKNVSNAVLSENPGRYTIGHNILGENKKIKKFISSRGYLRGKLTFVNPLRALGLNPNGYVSGSYYEALAFYKLKCGKENIYFKEYASLPGLFSVSQDPGIHLYPSYDMARPLLFVLNDLDLNSNHKTHNEYYYGDRPFEYRGIYAIEEK